MLLHHYATNELGLFVRPQNKSLHPNICVPVQRKSVKCSGCSLLMCVLFSFLQMLLNNLGRWCFLIELILVCHVSAFSDLLHDIGFAYCCRTSDDMWLPASASFWSRIKSCLIGYHTTTSYLFTKLFQQQLGARTSESDFKKSLHINI